MKRLRWGLIKQQMSVQFRVRSLNILSLGLFVIQPAVFSAVGMLLSHAAGNAMPDLVYSVIGGGIMGMWSGLVFSSTYDITGDRMYGTLELIAGSPTSLVIIEAIRTLTNVLTAVNILGRRMTACVLLVKALGGGLPFLARDGAHQAALLEYSHPVADLLQLRDAVGRYDQSLAPAAQLP